MKDSLGFRARTFVGQLRMRLRSALLASNDYPVLDPSDRDIDALWALDLSERMPVVINVRLADCRWSGATGYRYGADTAHPYVQSLLQYRKRGTIPIQETVLSQYYDVFQPATLAAFQGLGRQDTSSVLKCLPPLNLYPWSNVSGETLRKIADRSIPWPYSGFLHASQVFVRSIGPQPPGFVEERIMRLRELYNSISGGGFKSHADRRRSYFQQFIVGDVMVRDGDTRIVLANGQHRASVLSSLGQNVAPILVGVRHQRGPAVIWRDEVECWPLVREGIYDAENALKVFDGIFDGCGPQPCLPPWTEMGEAGSSEK